MNQDAPELLLELGCALHEAGSPAHRIEDTMSAVARGLGLKAEVIAQPTLLMVSTTIAARTSTRIRRVQPGQYDIARLLLVDDILDRTARGLLSLDAAVLELRATPNTRYPRWALAAAYVATGAAVAVLFGGSLVDVGATSLIAALTGIVGSGGWRTPHLLHVTSAVLASIAGSLANRWLGGSAATIVLASLIVLVPGLSLTLGLIELATRHLTSGSSRLMGAIITFLELGFGVALGQRVVELTAGPAGEISRLPLPSWAGFAVAVPGIFSLLVLFNIPLRHFWVVGVSCSLAFFGARFGSAVLSPLLGASVGAFAVAAFSNAYARLRRRPVALPLVPAVLLLVPGSVGYRSFESFLASDTTAALNAVFATFVIATSIASGLLVANTVVAPRRLL